MSADIATAYHVGVRVTDLDAAMDDFSRVAGLSWCSVQERDQQVWTPEGGGITTPLRFTYSVEGPLHVELLQGQPGTFWDANQGAGLHHTGVWVDDVAGRTKEFLDDGWTLAAAQTSPEDGYGVFTYVAPPSGFILELVDVRARPRFEQWWAGGDLG